ncbi:MAG: aspartate/tyrosine/aromatic aminotransferase [SAR324 cluster bacterium]|nr:aspartate/tyrosine/aromatic aminotransferase [SAR324 cluster bacterium]
MFKNLEMAPADPILGLNELFKTDGNPKKVNLTIGIYLDEQGICPVLSSVKQAEKILLEQETTKNYLSIEGEAHFGKLVREQLFGAGHKVLKENLAATVHTPGGTGALKVGADFVAIQFPGAAVWISDPSWANHRMLFSAAHYEVNSYPYLDAENYGLKFDAMLETLESVPEGNLVLVHGCCHNPTGIDLARDQWDRLAELFGRRSLIPFIDIAYQGLGDGLEEDAYGVRAFGEAGINMLVASSFSKCFGLYRERVGALTLLASSPEEAERALSNLRICVRTNYSSPPAHGGMIVDAVLSTPELQKLWRNELDVMRERIINMRRLFVKTLKAMGVRRDFGFLLQQKGMFSYTGITGTPVLRLRDEYGVYMLENGRINVAGITPRNVEYLCGAIAAVLEE